VPDFNLGLEYRLRRAGIPTVHYVSPTVWAWRRYRIRRIRKAVGHMMTLFPFEEAFYRQQGVPVTCVGHPLADRVEPILVVEARDRLGLPADVPVVALLPGSRDGEISRLGELFIRVARELLGSRSNLHFVVPCASPTIRDRLHLWANARLPPDRVTLIDGNAQMAMRAADVALLASGTAALEAALMCTPMVVAYRVSTMSFLMVKSFSTVKHYSMPNHLLEQPIVPEFIQSDATCDNLASAVAEFLDDKSKRNDMRTALAGIRESLALGADERAARIVIAAAGGVQ
jgi:lipid-A-disaccharide synthase